MINKVLHQTWVGTEPKPEKWMSTWKEKNPEWEYKIWDNDTIKELDIRCKKQFDYYWNKKMWHGVADIVRYHALYQFGGLQPGADSVCFHSVDDLFSSGKDLFTVACYGDPSEWEREDGQEDIDLPPFLTKDDKIFQDLVTPIHASTKGHPFLKILIDEIAQKETLGSPWMTTGNMLCKEMIKKHKPDIEILPMYTFIPYRIARTIPPRAYKYKGNNKVYSHHYCYTTNKKYHRA